MNPAPAAVIALLVLVAGCTAPGTGPVTDGDPVSVRAFPSFPTDLTPDAAGAYAAEVEEAYRHNAILATADVEVITSISVGCHPSTVTAVGDGYRVTVDCGFGWMFEDEGSAGVADGAPYRATYWVGGRLVERVGSTLTG